MIKSFLLIILYALIAWVKSRYFYLTVLLILSGLEFLDIVFNVLTQDEITVYDRVIIWLMGLWQHPEALRITRWITALGSAWWVTAGTILVAGGLLLARHTAQAILLIASTAGGALLIYGSKQLFARVRPEAFDIPLETGYSLPSGHATTAVTFYGLLIFLVLSFFSHHAILKILAWVAGLALILFIGLSRVYLGVHYPSDVLAGYCLGTFWTSLCILIYEKCRERREREGTASPQDSPPNAL